MKQATIQLYTPKPSSINSLIFNLTYYNFLWLFCYVLKETSIARKTQLLIVLASVEACFVVITQSTHISTWSNVQWIQGTLSMVS